MITETEARRRYDEALRAWAYTFLPGASTAIRDQAFHTSAELSTVLEISGNDWSDDLNRTRAEVRAAALASIEASKVPTVANFEDAAEQLGLRIRMFEIDSDRGGTITLDRGDPEALLAFERWADDHLPAGVAINVE